ncbi:MAG: serine/threonine protein kinase [Acidobacteriaceae bacterium]|nr:serine/threonine protein kinase [Acidobacteriaceae bacterium]MBV9778456.1 serine/threonine protein kinase [Acidobacteriaceae bacterium]
MTQSELGITTAHWQEVKSILDRVLDANPDDREKVLTELCRGDTVLRDEVKEFLNLTDRAEKLLPENGVEAAMLPNGGKQPDSPRRAGPYRILREIGRGGMGVVYLAGRDDGEYERLVALKLIGDGVHRAKFAKLFWRERQILARLDHPNIARLLDGGTTETGQPYYAMEFVEGEPLDKYCQRRSLTLREKLELFISVCSAVSYAHASLIIHRDLKPKNVLVTEEGVPKLLDFGVARILGDNPQPEKTTTSVPLTPLYASPEQIRGEPLTVATDIYSLGVLLYELLSGQLPYDKCESTAAAFRAILEEAPIPLRERAPDVPSDLENVLMMALRKEPERRYATVEAFCKDLRDFLDGFPVQAAPDTFVYRFSKFAKRHSWALLAASLALVGITISGVIVLREKQQAWNEKQQAEMRFQQVEKLAHSVVFELHDAIEDLPGSSRARELLIARGLEYLNALTTNRGRDPGLSFELAQAYMKIGAAQGDLEQANVGDREGALTSYNKARALLVDLHKQNPRNREIERTLALVDNDIAVLAPRARVDGELEIRKEAVSLFEDIARSSSGIQGLKDLALAHFYLAFAETEQQKFKEALPIWNQALAEYAKIQQLDNNSFQAQRNVALIEKRIAGVYYALGEFDKSLAHGRRAAEIDEARVTADPQSPTARMDLSFDLVELGWSLHELRHEKQAVDNLNRAILLRREVAAQDPDDFRAQSELETVLRIAGVIRFQAGSLSEALTLTREASTIGASLHARDPRNTDETVNFALDSFELGNVYRAIAAKHKISDHRNWQAALNNFQQSQTLVTSIPATAFDDPNDRENLTKLPEKIADCLQHIGG